MNAKMRKNWLDLIPAGDACSTAACSVCQEYGACRDWIEAMAGDAGVNVQWLAREVYRRNIEADWGVEDIKREYYKIMRRIKKSSYLARKRLREDVNARINPIQEN